MCPQFQQHFNTMLKICKKISKSQVTTRLMLLCSCKDLEVKPYLGTSKKSKLTKLSSWAHSTKVLTCQTSKQNLILNHYQTSLSLLELDFDATTSYQNVKRIHKKYGSCQHLLSRWKATSERFNLTWNVTSFKKEPSAIMWLISIFDKFT